MKKLIAVPSVVAPRAFQKPLIASELDYVRQVCKALHPGRSRRALSSVSQTMGAVEKLFNSGTLLTKEEKKLLQTLSMGIRLLGVEDAVQLRILEKLHHRMSEYRQVDARSFAISHKDKYQRITVTESKAIYNALITYGVINDSGQIIDNLDKRLPSTFKINVSGRPLNQKKTRHVLKVIYSKRWGISPTPLLDLKIFQSFVEQLEHNKAVLSPQWDTIQDWKDNVSNLKRPDDYIQYRASNVPYDELVRQEDLEEGKQGAGTRDLSITRGMDTTRDAATGTAIPNRSTNIEHIQPFQQLMSRITEMFNMVNSNRALQVAFQERYQSSGILKPSGNKLEPTEFFVKLLHSWDVNTVLMDGYLNILKGTLDPILYFQRNDFYGSSFVSYLPSDREVLSKGSAGLRDLFDRSGLLYRLKTDERVKPEHRGKLLGKVVIQWMAENLKSLVRQKRRLNRMQKDNLLESIANRFIKDSRTSLAQKEMLRQLVTDMRKTKRHPHKRRDDVRRGIREVEAAIGSTPVKHAVMLSTPGVKGKKRSGSGSSSDGKVSISSDDSQTAELRQKLVERDDVIKELKENISDLTSQLKIQDSENESLKEQMKSQAKRYDAQLEKQRVQIEEQMAQLEEQKIHIAQLMEAMQLQSQGRSTVEKEAATSKEN